MPNRYFNAKVIFPEAIFTCCWTMLPLFRFPLIKSLQSIHLVKFYSKVLGEFLFFCFLQILSIYSRGGCFSCLWNCSFLEINRSEERNTIMKIFFTFCKETLFLNKINLFLILIWVVIKLRHLLFFSSIERSME